MTLKEALAIVNSVGTRYGSYQGVILRQKTSIPTNCFLPVIMFGMALSGAKDVLEAVYSLFVKDYEAKSDFHTIEPNFIEIHWNDILLDSEAEDIIVRLSEAFDHLFDPWKSELIEAAHKHNLICDGVALNGPCEGYEKCFMGKLAGVTPQENASLNITRKEPMSTTIITPGGNIMEEIKP